MPNRSGSIVEMTAPIDRGLSPARLGVFPQLLFQVEMTAPIDRGLSLIFYFYNHSFILTVEMAAPIAWSLPFFIDLDFILN